MNKIIDQTFKVAIYLRLSKEDDDLSCSSGAKSESNSISNQRKLIYDFMKSHPELELYDEYKDDGKSGSNFDRAEFQRMMKDIEAGKVNCVVVKDQSRFGRDYIDVGKYKEKIFPKLGVRFITINEGYDSLSATSSDDFHSVERLIPARSATNVADSFLLSRAIFICSPMVLRIFSVSGIILYAAFFICTHPLCFLL